MCMGMPIYPLDDDKGSEQNVAGRSPVCEGEESSDVSATDETLGKDCSKE